MNLRTVDGIFLILIVGIICLAPGCGQEPGSRCAMCAKAVPAAGGASLLSADGEQTRFCCARCAVMYATRAASDGTAFTHVSALDHETGQELDLTEAFFVYGSDTVPCCVPSVLAVGSRETASDLAKHGGGRIVDYGGLRATLALEATERCEMCSKPLDFEAAWPCVLLATDGQSHVTCCPHCAFMLQKMLLERESESIREILCEEDEDVLFRLDEDSRFVADSDVPTCCRPTLVPRDSLESAGRFVGERGGTILTVEEARAVVHEARHAGRSDGS